MTTKPLCWVPYYTADITYKSTKPCCKFNFDQDLPYPDIRDFYSESAEQWRRDSFETTDQLLDQCSACRVDKSVHSYERQNRVSFEQRYGWSAPTTASLRKLIIGMDNICASSCLQCGPHFSTTLNNFAAADPNRVQIMGSDPLPGLQQLDFSKFDGMLGDVEILHLYGGEPLMSPNLDIMLEMVTLQSPKLKTISLSTGLCRIKARNLELLAELASSRGVSVEVNLSLDGASELNSWIRGITVADFQRGWQLLVGLQPMIKIIGLQTTLAVYNVFALDHYLDYVTELWQDVTTRVYRTSNPYIMSTPILRPESLSCRELPQEYKPVVANDLRKSLRSRPSWTHELLRTALNQVSKPAAIANWDISLNRMNTYTKWRGETRDWQYWWDHYHGNS